MWQSLMRETTNKPGQDRHTTHLEDRMFVPVSQMEVKSFLLMMMRPVVGPGSDVRIKGAGCEWHSVIDSCSGNKQ